MKSLLLAALMLALAPVAQALPRHDMVESADPRAAAIGRDILRAGGSAADAAVAAAVALTIVEPQSAGIGGGALLVYYDAKKHSLTALDGREPAPRSATQNLFLDASGKPIPFVQAMVGGRAVGAPGLLRLLALIHQRWGRLPWARLIAPSIALAEKGFALSPRVHDILAEDRFLPKSAAAPLYYEHGNAKQAGSIIVNPALAKTLRTIAQKGVAPFYDGPIAADMVAAVESTDPPGGLGAADLRDYRVKERSIACGRYRQDRVCGMGLPAGDVTVLEILGLLQPFDLAHHVADDEAWHLFAAATKLAYADRARWQGDPDFVPSPVKGLLDPAYLAARSKLIDPDRELPGKAAPGDPARRHADNWGDEATPEFPSTSNISIIDRDGNAVAMTATINGDFGSKLFVDGFLLNNELTDFSFVPEDNGRPVANRVEPLKRPLSAMSPTIVFGAGDKLMLVVGSAGGPAIITDVAKTLVGVIDWHDDLATAIALPNVENRNTGATEVESFAGAPALAAYLQKLGDTVRIDKRESGLGGILVTRQGFDGATDPRREGAALGD